MGKKITQSAEDIPRRSEHACIMSALLTRPGGRIASRDVAITIVLCLLGILLMGGNASDPKVDMSVPGIPLFLGVTIPLLWRRTAIVAAVLASFAALLVHDLLFGADPIRCGVVLPTTFLFAFAAGSLLEEHEARIALAVSMLPILAETITFFKAFGVVFLGLNAAMWGIGRVTRSGTLMADELAVRTAELRAARDERARLEVAADRARLSGELDELLRARLAAL